MKSFELFSFWLLRYVTSRPQNHFDTKESLPLRITWIDSQMVSDLQKTSSYCLYKVDKVMLWNIFVDLYYLRLSCLTPKLGGMNYIESSTAFFHHCWTNIHDNRLHSIGSFVNMAVVNASYEYSEHKSSSVIIIFHH